MTLDPVDIGADETPDPNDTGTVTISRCATSTAIRRAASAWRFSVIKRTTRWLSGSANLELQRSHRHQQHRGRGLPAGGLRRGLHAHRQHRRPHAHAAAVGQAVGAQPQPRLLGRARRTGPTLLGWRMPPELEPQPAVQRRGRPALHAARSTSGPATTCTGDYNGRSGPYKSIAQPALEQVLEVPRAAAELTIVARDPQPPQPQELPARSTPGPATATRSATSTRAGWNSGPPDEDRCVLDRQRGVRQGRRGSELHRGSAHDPVGGELRMVGDASSAAAVCGAAVCWPAGVLPGLAGRRLAGAGDAILPACTATRTCGTASAQFLRIPVGARAVALGQAYSAAATDGSALFWNPAGRHAHARSRQLFRLRTRVYTADIDLDYVACHRRGQNFGYGLMVGALRSGDILRTDELHQEGTGQYFNANQFFLGATPGARHDRPLLDRRDGEVLPGEPGRVPDARRCWPTWASSTSSAWATCASVSPCATSAPTSRPAARRRPLPDGYAARRRIPELPGPDRRRLRRGATPGASAGRSAC